MDLFPRPWRLATMDKKRDGHTLQTETEGLYLAMAEGIYIWLGN